MTQLCAIPGCRIRGRHLPGCADDDCRGCLPRSTDDGLVCDVDASRAAGHLAEIIQLTPDARLVASGLVRRGAGGGSGGKPGSRSPGNDDFQDALDEIQNALTTIARDIAETRGFQSPAAGLGVADPLSGAAKWLNGQMQWLRHAADDQGGPYAAGVFSEIRQCASRLRWMLDGPRNTKFFGPCGSKVGWDDDGQEFERDEPCVGDVYGRPDAEEATCRACKARWETAPRAKELGDKVREYAFSAKWIHEAYGINVKTIRSWADRSRLKTYWRTEADLTVEWAEPVVDPKLRDDEMAQREAEVAAETKARGPRLHYVGDVLDLAVADKVRQEGDRATRARRTAARAAESETAA